MRILIIAFLLSFLMINFSTADSENGFLEWQAPDSYTNGQALPYNQIANFGLLCDSLPAEKIISKPESTCNGFSVTNVLSTNCYDISQIGFQETGSYQCRVRAVDVLGNAGEWSNMVTVNFTKPPLVPAAPLNLM